MLFLVIKSLKRLNVFFRTSNIKIYFLKFKAPTRLYDANNSVKVVFIMVFVDKLSAGSFFLFNLLMIRRL